MSGCNAMWKGIENWLISIIDENVETRQHFTTGPILRNVSLFTTNTETYLDEDPSIQC